MTADKPNLTVDHDLSSAIQTANIIYEVESSRASHYETMNVHLTQFTFIATGALISVEETTRIQSVTAVLLLIPLAFLMAFISNRIGIAHIYHWTVVRQIKNAIAVRDPIVDLALKKASKSVAKKFGYVNFERMWVTLNFLVPCSAALYLIIFKLVFSGSDVQN